jgi:ABC-type antimicrobial peptide transport system permease subunit
MQPHDTPHSPPPRWADRLLERFCAPEKREEVLGDLHERYHRRAARLGAKQARWRYPREVFSYLRLSVLKRPPAHHPKPLPFDMIRNYLTIALRYLLKHKAYSIINIGGLSVGLTVALLIGLWVHDERSYDQYHPHYARIARVMEHQTLEGGIQSFIALPMPLSRELRTKYAADFASVVAATWGWDEIVAYGDKKLTGFGSYAEAGLPEMLSLRMQQGTRTGLQEPASVLLSQTLARALFGKADPMGKAITLGNRYTVQVRGVYQDLPANTTFGNVAFIAPMDLLLPTPEHQNEWRSSSFQVLAQLRPGRDVAQVSPKIKDVLYKHVPSAAKSSLFLHPMARWHLYSEFKNGVNTGGRIGFVWLFSLIGAFVLLLAAINFMNLSTARSEKRAREVGIRKTMGSVRGQLVYQFLSESWLVVMFAFGLSLLWVQLALPWFNPLAGKELSILWNQPLFWAACLGFVWVTGLLAGSYPALYLSGFQPVKVLKGTFRVGRWATVPRKVLVVVQFTVSITLVIGTLIVYDQIQFAKNRPLGYSSQGLVNVNINTPELHGRYDALRNDLLATGAAVDMAESSSPITGIASNANNFEWKGKDPNRTAMFGTISVTPGFGNVVGWKLKEGREFSRALATDSMSFVLNEAAVELTGLKNPVGETLRWHGKSWKVIGVVKDMVMTSPFEPVRPTVFMMNTHERPLNVIQIKLNPALSTRTALDKIGKVFKVYNPASPFIYRFADEEYARKFAAEERIGRLAAVFAGLAILISCLGLLGLVSFVAEQRTKEIGIRKVLGASVGGLWGLLSKDFILLVAASCLVAIPVAHYGMQRWLSQYEYRTSVSGWIFILAGLAALLITLLTVSYQALKAALTNPVKSLRNE